MKKNKKNLVYLVALGLLLMNGLGLINLIFQTNINIDIIDFLKGFGLTIIVWSAYKLAKIPVKNNS